MPAPLLHNIWTFDFFFFKKQNIQDAAAFLHTETYKGKYPVQHIQIDKVKTGLRAYVHKLGLHNIRNNFIGY